MIRRLARGLARRLVGAAPRVPNAPASGRARPSSRADWSPPPGASVADPADPPPPEEPPPEEPPPEVELSAEAVAARLASAPDSVVVLDIREPHELRQGHVEGAWVIPMNAVPAHLHLLPRDATVAVVCAAGMRSFGVAHYLREQGLEDAWSVPEGVGGLAHAGLTWTHPARAGGWAPGHLARTADGRPGIVQALPEGGDAVAWLLLTDGPAAERAPFSLADLQRG